MPELNIHPNRSVWKKPQNGWLSLWYTPKQPLSDEKYLFVLQECASEAVKGDGLAALVLQEAGYDVFGDEEMRSGLVSAARAGDEFAKGFFTENGVFVEPALGGTGETDG